MDYHEYGYIDEGNKIINEAEEEKGLGYFLRSALGLRGGKKSLEMRRAAQAAEHSPLRKAWSQYERQAKARRRKEGVGALPMLGVLLRTKDDEMVNYYEVEEFREIEGHRIQRKTKIKVPAYIELYARPRGDQPYLIYRLDIRPHQDTNNLTDYAKLLNYIVEQINLQSGLIIRGRFEDRPPIIRISDKVFKLPKDAQNLSILKRTIISALLVIRNNIKEKTGKSEVDIPEYEKEEIESQLVKKEKKKGKRKKKKGGKKGKKGGKKGKKGGGGGFVGGTEIP